MNAERLNRFSGRALVALSAIALITVFTGYFQAPQTDEGTGAHIFQLAIVALVPTFVVFASSADWGNLRRTARPLVASAALVAVSFAALYYLEHVWYLRH